MTKKQKIDGLGPTDMKYLRSAVRKIWRWSEARRLSLKRAAGRCESCTKKVLKLYVDHIEAVGPIQAPFYISRMFVPSSKLQVLCKTCHDLKTKAERGTKPLG